MAQFWVTFECKDNKFNCYIRCEDVRKSGQSFWPEELKE